MYRSYRKTPLAYRLLMDSALLIAATAAQVRADDADAAVAAIEKIGGTVHPLGGGWEIEFHLRGRSLTDEGLIHVAAIGNVVSLNLRDTKITGGGLVHLKDLSSLRWLHLERTGVNDEGIGHLAGLANLEYLNLYDTNISDRSLEQLKGLKRLQRLYVWRTEVTDAGVAQLTTALPDLKIVRGVDLNKIVTAAAIEQDTPTPKIDLKWTATGDRADVPKRSLNGINTQVFFENKSKQRVKLYWVSYGGELRQYAELDPGEIRQQNSYSRNIWMITDINDQTLGYFVVVEDVSRAVIPSLK